MSTTTTAAKTMTIYKVECSEAYMMDELGAGFALEGWGSDSDRYKGCDDGGEQYVIPQGYSVAEDMTGAKRLYDPRNNAVDIIGKSHPAIYDEHGNIVPLRRIA
jgi:hypothetical protein